MSDDPDRERRCEKCRYVKPSVRWAPDVRKRLCDDCWSRTPPDGGSKRSGKP